MSVFCPLANGTMEISFTETGSPVSHSFALPSGLLGGLNPVFRICIYAPHPSQPIWFKLGNSSVVASQSDSVLFGIDSRAEWFFGLQGLISPTHIAFIQTQDDLNTNLNFSIGTMI